MSDQQSKPAQSQSSQPGKEHEMHPEPKVERSNAIGPKLKGKVALITGGDSGIGRAVAVAFAQHGANVVISYLDEDKDALETRKMVEDQGQKALIIKGDVRSAVHCKELIDKAIGKFGQLDIVVNNAAKQFPKENFEDISESQLAETFETNIFSFFYISKAALPHLKKGSSIINTSSVTAYRGSDHLIDYASTKGAIVSFTRSLAKNLASKGIRVNGVAPGPIWTPLIPATFSKEHVDEFGTDVPLGRPGEPVEVAPSYVFLASEDSSYMTGQFLHPNGGEIINT
ncbi:SDR family oxidoreductase [Litoribacter ruber]|uniref:SDR family oxidoreductase n=1 Tax=Litoribacter ruber TaxID=702568 RepID=UPI001BD9F2F6|nr:SDR family oxidoreductase [Litoribacter ruber]MBT0813085.1 SDR family oxidoreductase [Litoribacter ruber]